MDILKHNHTMLKGLMSSLKNGNIFNLQGLLEILNTTTEMDVQAKLLSILSAYVMLNDAHIDAIVTYNPLYDKICNIIANCPPRNITITFNFLSALLYIDEEDSHVKKSLVVYAKNMIRSSGCLATMSDIFTSSMMHQDTWRALCRCLAESCRGVEANQSYCTHLVPMCVQRCSQRNMEVLMVLQSLLQNHTRNVNLFIESNGISLFKREFLHNDVCLQLLATVAQNSIQAVAIIVKTNICQHLRDFLHLYGPESQLGQWATIILYHTSRVEASYEGQKNNDEKKADKLNESLIAKMRPVNQICDLECSADTTKLFQNVMKEIIQCGAQKEIKSVKGIFPVNTMINRSQKKNKVTSRLPFLQMSQRNEVWQTTRNINMSYSNNTKPNIAQNESMQFNKTHELSFSFLRKQHINNSHFPTQYVKVDKVPKILQRTLQNLQTTRHSVRKNAVYESCTENNESLLNMADTNYFKPKFASTPKKRSVNETCSYKRQHSTNNTNNNTRLLKSTKDNQIKRRIEKKRTAKYLERSKIDKEIKHRSISGRFFDAINTSCTTLVKTVKNIFRPKSDLHETKEGSPNETSNPDTSFCSYSFTNYMRKRDAALKNECTNKSNYDSLDLKSLEGYEDFSIEMTNTCNTCNDTITLKRKLVHDDNLKQTIRKLKLGINLYGCDFKKISRTFWPNETYMSPAVLYNLYRKLIIK